MPFEPQELAKFTQAGRVISGAIGTSVETWARAEAGVILKTWAGRTKTATAAKAKGRARLSLVKDYNMVQTEANPGRVTVNAGLRKGAKPGRIWVRTKRGKFQLGGQISDAGGLMLGKFHFSAAQWDSMRPAVGQIASKISGAVARGLKTIGLARQSVVQIADALGIVLEAVAGGGNISPSAITQARGAVPSTGLRHTNGTGAQDRQTGSFFLEMVNRYPRLSAIGMDRTFEGVIAGRIKFFERNLKELTFLSAKKTAQAYPYVQVLKLAS